MKANNVRNSFTYTGETIPVVVLNNTSDFQDNMTYPQFYLTPIVGYSNDTLNIDYPNLLEEKIKYHQNSENSDSCPALRRQLVEDSPVYNPQMINQIQKKSKYIIANELNQNNDFYFIQDFTKNDFKPIDNEESLTNNEQNLYSNTSIDVKKVGKFTVTINKFDQSCSNIRSADDLVSATNSLNSFNIHPNNRNYNCSNNDFQQHQSRFKKTRIKELIERWFINGLNVFDCRFKVIPSNIMAIKYKNILQDLHEYDNNSEYNKGYCCYSNAYFSKDFKFWNNGDRISISGKPDYEPENYCKFHSHLLKLLDQNQNLNISKLVQHCFRCASSSLIRAVVISSPENENYTMNIDCNQAVNVCAPPVSPSVLTSVHMSNLPANLHNSQSHQSMVMLRCPTPVSGKKNIGPDSKNILKQPILMTDDSLMEIWQNSATNSHSYMTGTVYTDDSIIDDSRPSLYSVDHIPHIFYSIPQQPIPSISTTISNKHTVEKSNVTIFEQDNIQSSLSSRAIQEIENSMSSFKSVIYNLIQEEQKPLLHEIESLISINQNLKNELSKIKRRYEYLESVLREKNIPLNVYINHDIMSMPNLSTFS